jgi:hypothetical protein
MIKRLGLTLQKLQRLENDWRQCRAQVRLQFHACVSKPQTQNPFPSKFISNYLRSENARNIAFALSSQQPAQGIYGEGCLSGLAFYQTQPYASWFGGRRTLFPLASAGLNSSRVISDFSAEKVCQFLTESLTYIKTQSGS